MELFRHDSLVDWDNLDPDSDTPYLKPIPNYIAAITQDVQAILDEDSAPAKTCWETYFEAMEAKMILDTLATDPAAAVCLGIRLGELMAKIRSRPFEQTYKVGRKQQESARKATAAVKKPMPTKQEFERALKSMRAVVKKETTAINAVAKLFGVGKSTIYTWKAKLKIV